MAKKKEVKQKKVPFNVLKKGVAAFALAGVMMATPFMLTGCSGEKGDKGDPGAQGEQGIQGETGKGIADIDIVYEYDDNGKLWAVYTFTYTDGTTSEERVKVPKRMTSIGQLGFGEYSYMSKYAKVATKDDAPTLYLMVYFDDGSSGKVLVTEDMFVKTGGYEVPDFTQEGSYYYKISYNGKETSASLDIVDIADYQTADWTVSSVSMTNENVRTTASMKDLNVEIRYTSTAVLEPDPDPDGGTPEPATETIYAPLSVVAENYFCYETGQTSDTLSLANRGTYSITMDSKYHFTFDEQTWTTLDLNVYDPTYCNIEDISVGEDGVGVVVNKGITNLAEVLDAEEFECTLFEEDADGRTAFIGSVSDLNYDISKFNKDLVGSQQIPFTYQIEGQTGVYKGSLMVSVQVDLTGASQTAAYAGTYTIDASSDPQMTTFTMLYGNTINLYDNGVAAINHPYFGEMQFSYDTTEAEEGVLKIYDSYVNDWTYYQLDTTNKSITYYEAPEETPTTYTSVIRIDGMSFPAEIDIYGGYDEEPGADQARKSNVRANIMGSLAPYAFVDCVWVDSDTLTMGGRTFNVTSGNVLVEVTE